MSFPRYPAYKATGMDWLSEVPDHWSVNRLKLSVESCTNGVWGDEAKSDENDVICIRVADFDRQSLAASKPDEPTVRNVSDRDIEQRSLRNGDLLIEKSGGGEKQPVGAVVLYTGVSPAVCSNFVARMRLKRAQIPSFWKYVHHAAYSARLNTKSIKQTSGIQNLDQQQYLNEIAAYPPLEEQLSIANFLDHETGKIDALIAEQERLIELLQEKRQAVISHAVTKGLNPDAPMKDSGVEWLGEVPEHWTVKQTKHLCISIEQGWSPQCENEASDGAVPGVLKVGCVNGGVFRPSENKILPAELQPLPQYRIKAGDLLVSRANTKELVGSAAVVGSDFPWLYICDKLYRITVDPRRSTTFYLALYLASNEARGQIELGASGASQSMQNISQSVLLALLIPVPPLKEQEEIQKFILSKRNQIDGLMLQTREAILLLQERRSALISAAVTGQIDVRGLVTEEEGA